MNCIKCKAEMPPQDGPGRPSRYCSAGCKRAAGYEITRLNRHIQRLEERLSDEREKRAYNAQTQSKAWLEDCGNYADYRIEAIQGEIDIAEVRLAELCAD